MEQPKTDRTYWHPAFYADIQIEFAEEADHLEFENEHQLGTNPLEIDVLVIKKEKDFPIKKNIGRIFRKYNIIEYKSPDDSLGVDDFYKVYGYTCFYKADVPFANNIPAQQLTITFVAEKYPRKLIRHLQEVRGYSVRQKEPGIYYVYGDFIPIQIIITKKLSHQKNLWMKSLTNKLSEPENAKKLIADYRNHPENNLYESVLKTIIRANRKTFEEVNDMSDFLLELDFVKDKFNRRLDEAIEREKVKLRENMIIELKKDMMEHVKKDVTERVTKDVTERVTKNVTKRVTNDVTERVTKDVTERVTKDVTERVTKDVTERVTKDVTERVTKDVTENVSRKTKLMESISLILKKCLKDKSLPVIADEMETSPEELSPLYNLVTENMEKSAEQIYELAIAQEIQN